jgi:hypothetical protein
MRLPPGTALTAGLALSTRARIVTAAQALRHNRARQHRQNGHQSYLPRSANALMYVECLRQALRVQRANNATAVNWNDAKRRVLHSYRDWLRSVCPFLPTAAFTVDDKTRERRHLEERRGGQGRCGQPMANTGHRLPRCRPCTRSICQSLHYGRRYDKSSSGIDT